MRPYSFFVLPSSGHTLKSVALIAEVNGARVAFTGDLMLSGGTLYQLHAMEYDHGDLAGANWTAGTIYAVWKPNLRLALPSLGLIIDDFRGEYLQSKEGWACAGVLRVDHDDTARVDRYLSLKDCVDAGDVGFDFGMTDRIDRYLLLEDGAGATASSALPKDPLSFLF